MSNLVEAELAWLQKARFTPTGEHAAKRMTKLARELEAHCEAMAAALYRLEINADMLDEPPELAKWNRFVKECGT